MKIIRNDIKSIDNSESIREDFIETIIAYGGIGKFRGCNDCKYPNFGEKIEGCMFENNKEVAQQFDYEPSLILIDEGEYGIATLILYESYMENVFIEYTYQWKGNLIREYYKTFKDKYRNKILKGE